MFRQEARQNTVADVIPPSVQRYRRPAAIRATSHKLRCQGHEKVVKVGRDIAVVHSPDVTGGPTRSEKTLPD